MKTPEHIQQLLVRHVWKDLSAQEAAELASWRGSSEANERFFQKATDRQELKAAMERMRAEEDVVVGKVMQRFGGAMGGAGAGALQISHPRYWKVLRIAAILVVSLGITWYVLFDIDFGPVPGSQPANGHYKAEIVGADGFSRVLSDARNGFADGYAAAKHDKAFGPEPYFTALKDPGAAPGAFNTVRTQKGARYGLVLPDGALVWLNEATSVKFPANYIAGSSEISVTGEVYIEWKKDSTVPVAFHASAANMQLQVSRGKFNIRAYPGDSIIKITLISGDMKMQSPAANGEAAAETILQPHDQLQLVNGKLILRRNVDVQKVAAWKMRDK